MNPFELHGPEFLIFYAALSLVVVCILLFLRRIFEWGPIPKFSDIDPYLIAYLRGGQDEAIRVATISLVDRGLLQAKGDFLTTDLGAVTRVRRSFERRILEVFREGATVSNVFLKRGPREACRALEEELKEYNLLPGPKQALARVLLGLGAVAFLWWVAYIKIEVAFSRGRHNVSFLVTLALVVPVIVIFIQRSRRTALGHRVLDDLKTLFSRLRDRAAEIQPGGATNELALLAGVFGLSALSGAAFEHAERLFPNEARVSESGYTGDDNSSSGSSSCGSSCGGGGCGGGCGGCGS